MRNINPHTLAKSIFAFYDNQSMEDIEKLNSYLATLAKEHCMQGNIGKCAFLYAAINAINNASVEKLKVEIADAKINRTFTNDPNHREELADQISVDEILIEAHKKSQKISLANYEDIGNNIPIA